MIETARARFSLTASLLVAAACGGPVEENLHHEMSWEEFLTVIHREPDTGIFIVDGDTPIVDEKILREFFAANVAEGSPLIVHRTAGADARWTDTRKRNLTYCVSTGFGSRYNTVVSAMSSATAAWEGAADVDFIHVSAEDSRCTASNAAVLFDVRPVNVGGQYLARAFFPGQSRSTRNILIDNTAFTSSWPLVGVLRHEVGHTLGFRHEHTRPESGTCFEDSSWRVLTPYDRGSVMHYPQCNGVFQNFVLTALDQQGAAALYGAPGQPPPPPPPPATRVTQRETGSLALDEIRRIPAITVQPGSVFDARMAGTGDADLYVRVGSEPTLTSFTCRPYLSTASETCSVQVPSTASTVHVMVHGYTASTFDLTIEYTAP